MTLTELFTEWAKQPQFAKLAGSYRPAFTNVFLKNFADRDIQTIDKEATKEMLLMNSQPMGDRIRACSTLVQILQYGCTKGYCNFPNFYHTIANEANQPAKIEEKTPESPQPEAKAKREKAKKEPKTLRAIQKARRELELGKKRKISKPKAVVQLDPKTYEPIKTYNSAGAAGRAVGSSNILRAVKEHTMSAGYFWAFENEVKDFTPSKLSLTHRAERFKRRKLTPIPAGVTNEDIEAAIEEIDAASEQLREQQEQLEAERQEKRHILAEYTDDELLGEIRRREWRGNVIIPVNYEL